MDNRDPTVLFEIFTEIGIIEQLTRARLEAHLPKGLIAPHFTVLNHLTRLGDGATPVDMARAFQVPKTSMTHTLKGLEKGGYVVLRPNPQDGRSKQVMMTDLGRDLHQATISAMAPDMGQILMALDGEKLLQVKPVLAELRSYLDAARD